MGLDFVEMVMEWEDEFGIVIPNEAAERLVTPRLATDYIFSQLEPRDAGECIRQQTFFRLRRGFRAAGTRLPSRPTPQPTVSESSRPARTLLPPDPVRFEPATRLRSLVSRREWPEVWSVVRREDRGHSWPEAAPFRGMIAFRVRTVGDLVQELSLSDLRSQPERDKPWTRELVSLQVRRVVEETVGLRFFDEDDHFLYVIGVN